LAKKRVLKTIGLSFIGTIIIYVIWLNLPPTINRYRDIKLANKIIEKVDRYREVNGLPDRHDWETLKQFGFTIDGDVWKPQYEKINDITYELVFVEGFDGPYLLWTSSDRKWKVAMPTIPEDYKN
jgi:hypothetical protein